MDPTDTLLLLYEFEARAKLNDPEVETVLESVLELENIETKVLETIAGKKNNLCCTVNLISAGMFKKQTRCSICSMLASFSVIYVALAMEPPAHFPLLCKKALRVALSLHKKQPQADLDRCRYAHHYSA